VSEFVSDLLDAGGRQRENASVRRPAPAETWSVSSEVGRSVDLSRLVSSWLGETLSAVHSTMRQPSVDSAERVSE